ncbi:MAG TPA: ABC transporter ATP-binding protein [bacterium]|nr:ABC transporter ATP-binding protein [bacterium]
MFLEISGVSKVWKVDRTREEIFALEDINLNIERGRFIVLLGPSGCGKSTLLQIIAGLEKPSRGEVRFGIPQNGGNRKPTCMVFQEYALFPWRTVFENVVFGPELRGVPRSERNGEAMKYIELVNLRGFEKRYPHELSGGMKQRVAIARALANDPEIILFDEPLAALDAQTRTVLQGELVRIWQETKKTFIYVTHSLEESVLLADDIVVMTARPGKIKDVVTLKILRPRNTVGAEEVKVLALLQGQIKEEVEKSLLMNQLETV